VDINHEITYFNPAAEKMFAYESGEVIGKKLGSLLVPKQDEEMAQKGISMFMADYTNLFKNRTIKVTAMTKDGYEIPIELSLSKLKLNDTLHAVAIIRDITERRKAAQLRKRLVNDLHDGVGGSISNIKLLAEMSKAHDVPEQTSKNLNAIAEISEDCMTEIRNYMNILDDTELSWQSFTAELHQYCAKTLGPHDIHLSMKVDINIESSHPTTLLYMNVFKIIKEALNNIIKHSDGHEVFIDTLIKSNCARWIIKDNGSGKAPSQNTGRGILSMTSRVKELGGVIKFYNENGFNISLNIPFTRITVREQVLHDRRMNPHK
jgi:PAS domain S-box-containing protein